MHEINAHGCHLLVLRSLSLAVQLRGHLLRFGDDVVQLIGKPKLQKMFQQGDRG